MNNDAIDVETHKRHRHRKKAKELVAYPPARALPERGHRATRKAELKHAARIVREARQTTALVAGMRCWGE